MATTNATSAPGAASTDLEEIGTAERHLLAALLRDCEYDGNGLDDVIAALAVADFYAHAHQLVFGAMIELRAQSVPVGVGTVAARLRDQKQLAELGPQPALWLAELLDLESTGAAAPFYADKIREASRLRKLRRAAAQIVLETNQPTGSAAEVAALCERVLHEAADDTAASVPRSIGALVSSELYAIDTRHENGPEGLPIGFADVDRYLNGLRSGQLLVIGARPAVGKTSLALGIAAKTAASGAPSLFVSLEMPAEEITQRLLAARSGVRLNSIRAGQLDADQVNRLTEAARDVSRIPLAVDDTPNVTVDRLAAVARRAVRRDGLKLLVVDYLQLLTPENPRENRNAQVGLQARRLKLLARALGIPVVVLCQLNRESENRPDARPRLSDLRDSGEIEQHADIVLLLSPQRAPANGPQTFVDVGIAKNRNGATGEATLAYVGALTRFENATH